jgi:hypothetical protein
MCLPDSFGGTSVNSQAIMVRLTMFNVSALHFHRFPSSHSCWGNLYSLPWGFERIQSIECQQVDCDRTAPNAKSTLASGIQPRRVSTCIFLPLEYERFC